VAGKNATLNDYHGKPAPLATEATETKQIDSVTVLNTDRLAFSDVAQTIFATDGWEQNELLSGIKKVCEERIEAIDSTLNDV
jgi:hypothetical protein